MRLTPMSQFLTGAAVYLSTREMLSLEERLRSNPEIGKPIPKTSGTLRHLTHPATGKSDYGYRPVVVYIFDKASDEIILVDVSEKESIVREMLKSPGALLRIATILRFIKDFMDSL